MAFNWLKNMVTGLPRGLGQLVQGKPRGAIGAFSDTVKPLAIAGSAIPGPWSPIALPLAAAAAGGVMQKFDDEGHRGITDFLKGGVKGATTAYGAGKVGGLARSGLNLFGGGGATVPGAIPTPDLSTAVANTKAGGGMFSGIGKYLGKHPEVPLGIASTAADVYGANQQGAMLDIELQRREDERKRREKLEQLQTLMSFVSNSMGRRY